MSWDTDLTPQVNALKIQRVLVKANSSVLDFWENSNSVGDEVLEALEDRSVNVGGVRRTELPGLST